MLCHFDHAATVWYSCSSQSFKTKLQTTQNKLIRAVSKLHPRTHLDAVHFRKVSILKVENRAVQIKSGVAHKIVNKTAPPYLADLLNPKRLNLSHNTRGSLSNFIAMRFQTYFGKNTLAYTATCLWNELPMSLKLISNERSFKSNLKKWLPN